MKNINIYFHKTRNLFRHGMSKQFTQLIEDASKAFDYDEIKTMFLSEFFDSLQPDEKATAVVVSLSQDEHFDLSLLKKKNLLVVVHETELGVQMEYTFIKKPVKKSHVVDLFNVSLDKRPELVEYYKVQDELYEMLK